MNTSKQGFMQGVIVLMVSQFIIKISGLISKIYLTNKSGFGDTGNAIFSAGFQIYTMFLAISSIGVPNAIAQLISAKSAVGDNRGAYRIFKIAISIFGFIGFIGTAILFLNSHKIANIYLGIPEAELTIMALAPSIFIVAVSSVLRGYFNGKEKISVTAHSQSLEQILKTIFTIVMVEIVANISIQNTSLMVAIAAIGITVATFFSFMYLCVIYKKNKKHIWKDVITSTYNEKESIMKIVKNILYLSMPMAFTSLLATSNRTIDAVTIVNYLSKFMPIEEAKMQYGILTGKVESLIVLPYSFNIAFATTLIPTISASNARGEMNIAIKRIKFSILLSILISLPCMAVFIFFPEQILRLLFPNAYLGKNMLQLCSLSIVWVAVTQTMSGVLQGIKRVKEPAIAIAIGSTVKLILNIILLPIKVLNINGAIIATIVSHITICIITFYYVKKYITIEFNIYKFIIKPIIATVIMIILAIMVYNINILDKQEYNLIISLITGIIAYIFSIVMLKVFSKEEMHMLPFINKTKLKTPVK